MKEKLNDIMQNIAIMALLVSMIIVCLSIVLGVALIPLFAQATPWLYLLSIPLSIIASAVVISWFQ